MPYLTLAVRFLKANFTRAIRMRGLARMSPSIVNLCMSVSNRERTMYPYPFERVA